MPGRSKNSLLVKIIQSVRGTPFSLRSAFFVSPDGLERYCHDLVVDSHKAFGILEFLTVFLRKIRREGLELLCFKGCIGNEKLPANDVLHLTGVLLINRPIRGQSVDLALLIADDCDLILKGHIFLNVATDNRLHCLQGIVDLNHLGVLVRLHKQDGNLSAACFYRLLAERFVERNRLEPDTVHEVEAGIQGVALPDFDYIRHRKRASFVVGGMVDIELLIDVFERDAVHFAVINSVVPSEGIQSIST